MHQEHVRATRAPRGARGTTILGYHLKRRASGLRSVPLEGDPMSDARTLPCRAWRQLLRCGRALRISCM